MNKYTIAIFTFLSLTPVYGDSYFPIGSNSEFLGVGDSAEGSSLDALLYNPATLAGLSPATQSRVEVAWISVRQSYEHPDFDPVEVKVATPFAAASLHGKSEPAGVFWGFGFIPTGNGKLDIVGLPRRILGSFTAVRAEYKTQSFDASFAVARKLQNFPLRLGARMMLRHEKTDVDAKTLSSGNSFAKLSAKGDFWLPSLGMGWETNDLRLGLSYDFSKKKSYRGRESSFLTEGDTSPTVINYEPAVLRFGSSYTIPNSQTKVKLQTQRLFYSAGKGDVRESLSSAAVQSDLHDATDFSAGIVFEGQPTTMGFSIGTIGSAWGEGYYNDLNPELNVIGRDFGKTRSVKQTHLGLLVGSKVKDVDTLVAVAYAFGKAESSSSAHAPGFFQSELMTVSASMSYEF